MSVKMLPYSPVLRKNFVKNRSIRFALLLFVFASFTALSVGQTALVSTSGGGKSNLSGTLLPLSEIKEGMKGTARTVFRGSEPEEFNVEIPAVSGRDKT